MSILLQTGAARTVITATYRCARGESFQLLCVNAGVNALVLLPVTGKKRILVKVVSGAGRTGPVYLVVEGRGCDV